MYDFKNVFYFHSTITPQGFISDIGGNFFQTTEIKPETFIGQKFSDIVFWHNNAYTSENIANSITFAAAGKPLEIETNFYNNAEQTSLIKAKFTPLFDSNNQVEKIIFTSTNVTEFFNEVEYFKKRSERFLYAAESAEVGLWFWDLITQEMITTPRCNEIFGFNPQEVMSFERFRQVFYPDDIEKIQTAINQSQTNLSEYNVEYRIIDSDNKIRWVTARGKSFKESENSHVMMGSVRDITHRKLADERFQNLLTAEKLARDEVEEVNRAKDNFMAIVSHELRSPLNSILGWAKILTSNKVVDDATRQKALETIENSAILQAKLISDLVDSAKIISGKLEFTFISLSLKSLINQVYQSEKPSADVKNIEFVLGNMSESRVMADASRLQQAIANLMTNAIKFTPQNGKITVDLKEDNGNVIFRITDSGQGILPEELPHIFKQYFQSTIANNKTGLGLGLSIVKAIITKHGGQVSAENNENGIGCTFFVSMPIKQNRHPEKTATAELISANPLENVEILVVEDNIDSREVIQFYLEQTGANVRSFESAQKGFEYLTTTVLLPAIIISDLSMPEEDGYYFIKKVRGLPPEKGGNIPAIALTAFASANDCLKTAQAGFQKHHTKPFEGELLVEEILSLISD
jgi:PAS domain S-box-containing protein